MLVFSLVNGTDFFAEINKKSVVKTIALEVYRRQGTLILVLKGYENRSNRNAL